MTLKLDCELLNTKKALLQKFADVFEEMYSLNYDALADAATAYQEDMTWEIANYEKYENPPLLLNILEDIAAQNEHIKIVMQ